MRVRSSKVRVFSFDCCFLADEVIHWLYISKFTRLRAVSRLQHSSSFSDHGLGLGP